MWDLTLSPLQIDFVYNGEGLIDDQAHATLKLGIQDSLSGSGVWLLLDYDTSMNTFDPDPPGSPTWDLDDVLILQKNDGEDQTSYDHPAIPEDSWVFPIYYDRDGVTPYQTTNPQYIDGATYNTQGEYRISLIINAVNETHGFAYMMINDQIQGYILGANPYPPQDTQPEIEIIVDDPEATYIGDWFTSTWVPGYYGDGYNFHWAGNGTDTSTWTYDLPYQGTWEVFARCGPTELTEQQTLHTP